ncbi:hypothetical protein F4780DRAFT_253584 [Xylariomycetidae sp. FL0641]|nr:hypothetical protein F4780DRAFT_253584 [Xylariomycetidae sp. FL0641]
MAPRISDHVALCTKGFREVRSATDQASGTEPSPSLLSIEDNQSKFRVWSGNIGAHHVGQRSLDYRLRDATHIQKEVIRLLTDLEISLEQCRLILAGEKIPWENEALSDEDDESLDLADIDIGFESEIAQLTADIAEITSALLKFSVVIRNPAQRNRLIFTPEAGVSFYAKYDIRHVRDKFPSATSELHRRLGHAITCRREYLKYRESHRTKLSEGFENDLLDVDTPAGRHAMAPSTIASSIPQELKDAKDLSSLRHLDLDERSDSGFTQTSFATSLGDTERLQVPPLPKGAGEGPVECPLCYMMISVSSKLSWNGHGIITLKSDYSTGCPIA